MGQANQAVALGVAAREQGAARRRAQRRRGVRAREQDAFGGELVEPRAGDVGVAVGAEVAAEVVPMHEQHVVSLRGQCLSFLPSVHRTVPMRIRQPFGSRRATYPQTRIHPQVGIERQHLGGPKSAGVGNFARMFDQLVTAAAGAGGAGPVGAWARVENAACAQRLFAIADVLEARLSADGSAQREQWCLDNWDAVAAEVAAVHNVSLGVASHQLVVACALRERLPRVADVFAAGHISYRVVNAIVGRTRLIKDPAAMGKVDAEVAAEVIGWGALSVAKTEAAIDYWVDRYDPNALVRTELSARGRHVDVVPTDGGTGLAWIEGTLFSTDAAALDKRLDAMARAVCEADPRTLEQRRADALGALAHGGDRLACGCDDPDCSAGRDAAPGATVVHVIAEERSLADDTPVQLDGEEPPRTGPDKPLREMTIAEALAP